VTEFEGVDERWSAFDFAFDSNGGGTMKWARRGVSDAGRDEENNGAHDPAP
jgi:hypothetical protein